MALVEHITEDTADFIATITPEVSHMTFMWFTIAVHHMTSGDPVYQGNQ